MGTTSASRLTRATLKASARCASVLVAVFGPAAALGQPLPGLAIDIDQLRQQTQAVTVGFNLAQSIALPADLDGGGEAGVWRTRGGVAVAYQFDETSQIIFNMNGEYSHYDFDGVTTLLPGDPSPIDDVFSASFSPIFVNRVTQEFGWFVGGLVEFSGEADADFGDSILGGGFGGVGWRFSDELAATIGVSIVSRLEDDPQILPLIGLSWSPAENVRLYTTGPGLALEVDVTEEWLVRMKGRWEPREFRLSDDATLSEGVVQDDSVIVSGELAWRPRPDLELALEVGSVVYQEFELQNSNGDTVSTDDTDPALYLALRFNFRF